MSDSQLVLASFATIDFRQCPRKDAAHEIPRHGIGQNVPKARHGKPFWNRRQVRLRIPTPALCVLWLPELNESLALVSDHIERETKSEIDTSFRMIVEETEEVGCFDSCIMHNSSRLESLVGHPSFACKDWVSYRGLQ